MKEETIPAFELSKVSKEYHLDGGRIVPVLRDFDLRVDDGEWLGLTGPSGCGKTTLLHLLGALDTPDLGTILCLKKNLTRLSARAKARFRRHTIGFMFQTYHLLPELNALENVMLPAMADNSWSALRRKAAALLAEFNLEQRLEHRPQELSGGEQQRVALARALINNPKILLADEPTGNLDQDAARVIMDLLKKMRRQQGATIVMVTHDPDIAADADRVFELKQQETKGD